MGADPHTALALAVLPAGPEAWQERDLEQLLSGAVAVLEEAGASLIGGHSGEGAELGFGLTVNGLATPSALTRKRGLKPGDALVLTKPLGTGALFAASMRGKARARWIEAALRSMQQPSRRAAELCRKHGAVALTDVTGFGLAGHLLEMLRASNADAELVPGAMPALPGALETLAAGIASTLAPSNLKLGVAVEDRTGGNRRAEVALLYDPQTAGGLIAGLPAASVGHCVAALAEAGYGEARVIGRVVERKGEAAAIRLVA
jgi:selenide,water dikinase